MGLIMFHPQLEFLIRFETNFQKIHTLSMFLDTNKLVDKKLYCANIVSNYARGCSMK